MNELWYAIVMEAIATLVPSVRPYVGQVYNIGDGKVFMIASVSEALVFDRFMNEPQDNIINTFIRRRIEQ